MTVLAAAVVAHGDSFLFHAEDGFKPASLNISRVEYRYKNLGPLEITSEYVGPGAQRGSAMPLEIPTLSALGLVALTTLVLLAATAVLRRRRGRGGPVAGSS